MLSTGAFNALLKTLEEPPEHVKFILATTEPQKLPATILSRCQRFDFKKISNENIIKRLKIVCEESNIEITEEALNTIAILSEGAMRDALSILERCIQDGDTNIDEDKVKDLVGIPKLTYINQLTRSIIENDVESALQCVEEVLNDGKEITNFLWETIKYVKDILVYKTSKNTGIYNKTEIENIQNLSEKVSKERLLNIIYQLSELENEIKMSSQKIIMFQTGIIKLCMVHKNEGTEELENRIAKLEQTLSNGTFTVKNVANVSKPITQNTVKKVENVNKPEVKSESKKVAGPIESNWKNIVNDFKSSGKIMLYTNLINTNAKEINDMTVGIEFPNGITPFGKAVLEKSENINEIEKQVSIMCGKEMRVKFIDAKKNNANQNENASSIEAFAKNLDVPFNIIED
jgi:DNA polymerase-3 subunit gamma/tau